MPFTLFDKYKQHYKDNLILAGPIVVSQIGHMATHIADSIIVGHFAGTKPLAAVSLVNSLFMMILVIGMGLAYGLTPLIAQAQGRLDKTICGKLLANSLVINCLSGVILFLGINFGTLAFIDQLGQDTEVVAHAKPYLFYLSISIIPLMVFQTFKQFAEGLGFTYQAMRISIIGNVINIILGIIFVKGMFGINPMGVKGVGLSTLIDRIIMAIIMVFYVIKSSHFSLYLEAFKLQYIKVQRIKELIRIGAPVALQYIFEISAFSGAVLIIGMISADAQAAHQIAISLAALTYMVASGVASAATIKTGNFFGKKNFFDLRRSAIASYHVVIIFMTITAIVFVTFNGFLPKLYTSDNTVIVIASQLLIIAGLFQLFDGTQVLGLGVLRGIGDVNIPTFITFLSYWVLGIPLGYYLGISLNLGVNGIWYGLTIGLLTASILLFFRFQSRTKKLNK
ncbi:MAG: MATE family efflux transporter [Pedobacter sp.]|nr:MAG: MATE family efflux transporter [Pedobacter sp.]